MGILQGWSIHEGSAYTSKDRRWCVGGEDNEDVLDNTGPEHDMNSMGMRYGFVGVVCNDFGLDGAYSLLSSLHGLMPWICQQISIENTWMF